MKYQGILVHTFCVVLLLHCAVAWPLEDKEGLSHKQSEITYLPGFKGNLKSRHYGGYITVDQENERNLYYYLVLSERDPKNDPVVGCIL
jgi:hypothetical protein